MKKITELFLSFCVAILFVGCSSNSVPPQETTTTIPEPITKAAPIIVPVVPEPEMVVVEEPTGPDVVALLESLLGFDLDISVDEIPRHRFIQSPVIEKIIEEGSKKIYVINPDSTQETCTSYGFSSCFNIVVSEDNTIIFSDFSKEASIGSFVLADSEAIFFKDLAGEGNPCGGGSLEEMRAYVFDHETVFKRHYSENVRCSLDDCNCTKESEWIRTNSTRYFDTDHKLVSENKFLKDLFQLVDESKK
jgi:hypothetical protein